MTVRALFTSPAIFVIIFVIVDGGDLEAQKDRVLSSPDYPEIPLGFSMHHIQQTVPYCRHTYPNVIFPSMLINPMDDSKVVISYILNLTENTTDELVLLPG